MSDLHLMQNPSHYKDLTLSLQSHQVKYYMLFKDIHKLGGPEEAVNSKNTYQISESEGETLERADFRVDISRGHCLVLEMSSPNSLQRPLITYKVKDSIDVKVPIEKL